MPVMQLVRSRSLALVVLALWLSPAPAVAQAVKAGVVTTLEGNVTVARASLSAPRPLKFKDDVFAMDRIVTGERSLARVLLGGKAVVTVRERSHLTVTEIPGKSTIEVQSGKIAVAVARERLRPGESIEVRTPNAVAGVRGTVFVVEVIQASAQAGGGGGGTHTVIGVLRGSVNVTQFNPATNQTVTTAQVNAGQAFRGTGAAPGVVQQMTVQQQQQAVAGLKPSAPQHVDAANAEQLKQGAVKTTEALLIAITGGPAPSSSTSSTQSGEGEKSESEQTSGQESTPSSEPTQPASAPPPEPLPPPTESAGGTGDSTTVPIDATTSGGTTGSQEPTVTELSVSDDNDHTAATNESYDKLTQTGGTLGGAGTVTFTGAGSTWSGGEMTGTGTTKIGSAGSLAISGGATKTLDGHRVLSNDGTVTWTGGSIAMGMGTRIENAGTFDIQAGADGQSLYEEGSADRFLNTGTLKKSGGAGTAGLAVDLENTGSGAMVDAQSGILRIQSADVTNASGATLQASGGGTLRLSSSTVTNTGGTIQALADSVVEFSGTTVSGGTLGTAGDGVLRTTSSTTLTGVSITGRYEIGASQSATIGGTTTVTASGQVVVQDSAMLSLSGSVTNAGTLSFGGTGGHATVVSGDLTHTGTLSVAAGNQFSVESGATFSQTTGTTTVAGDFANAGSLTIGAGTTFSVDAGGAFAQTDAGATTTIDGTMTVSGDFSQSTGTTTVNGTLEVNGTTSITGGAVVVNSSALFSDSGGFPANVAGDVLSVTAPGEVAKTGAGPVIQLSDSSHQLATNVDAAIVRLTGVSTAAEVDADAIGLTVGTDRPLHGGTVAAPTALGTSILRLSGAAVGGTTPTQSALKVDTALLEATAPVIVLLAAADSSSFTLAKDAIELVQKAKLVGSVPGDALVKLNGSTMTLNNGSLINVAGGSFAKITGDLVSLTNATLNITGGGLVLVSGTSVFVLSGGTLARFAGASALNINSAPACVGCTLTTTLPNLAGVPVLMAPGATVTAENGFAAFAGGTPTYGAGAAAIVVRDTGKVQLRP